MSEIATIEQTGLRSDIASLNDGTATLYSSINADTFDGKLQVLDILGTTESVSDHLGETFNLKDVIVQAVTIEDDKTGEVSEVPRVILIDDTGVARYGISTGLFSAVRNIFALAGEPKDWPAPITVQAVEEKTRRGFKVMTLRVVTAK